MPSVHEKTGLAVTELGDSGGYRLYYHDEDGLVNLLAYDDDTDWRYDGPVSLKKTGGMAIAALQTKGTNVSVAYPYDAKNIAVARFNKENKNKWTLGKKRWLNQCVAIADNRFRVIPDTLR